MYDESKIDWHMFGGDPKAHARVGYCAPDFIEWAAKIMKLPKDEVQRQWKQLMYFFATIYVLAKCGSLLPGNKPLQPPPKLEPIWRFFRERMPAQFTEYCHVFWGGQDVGWRESYPPEHQLTVQRLVMIRRTAGQGMTGKFLQLKIKIVAVNEYTGSGHKVMLNKTAVPSREGREGSGINKDMLV